MRHRFLRSIAIQTKHIIPGIYARLLRKVFLILEKRMDAKRSRQDDDEKFMGRYKT